MLKRLCIFSLPLLLLGSTAFGQVTLVPKLNDGDSYKTRTTVKTDQKLTIAGQDGGTTSNTVVEQKTTVGKRDAAGKVSMTVETNLVSSEVGLPGGVKIKFDAKNPDAKDDAGDNPIAELVRDKIKANAKQNTTVVLDKDHKVLEVQGIKEGSGIDERDIKEEVAEELKEFSDKPLKKGDTWERDVKVNLGQGQILALKRKYTYEGETSKSTIDSTRKVHKITAVDSAATLTAREGGAFKFTKSDLKVDVSSNTILFDQQVGHRLRSAPSSGSAARLPFPSTTWICRGIWT